MTKKNDLESEQKASAEFDEALTRLSILTTPLDLSAVQGDQPISQIESNSSFRDGLMDEILANHPGLTRETLDRQMKESGF